MQGPHTSPQANTPRRRTATLRDGLDQRLLKYALAAGAGLLATGQTANAAYLYIDPGAPTYTSNIPLDLDQSGDAEVWLSVSGGSFAGSTYQMLSWSAGPGNGVSEAPLPEGALIGPSTEFQSGAGLMASVKYYADGALPMTNGWWANVTGQYLAIEFMNVASIRVYGWVRLDVSADPYANSIVVNVKDWAYDTTGRPIVAGADPTVESSTVPEPASLGLLALGAAGMALWRRKRTGGHP